MKPALRTLALGATALCCAGAIAGVVKVSFVNPSSFSDAGSSEREAQDNQRALSRHLQQLGRQLLPANQTLRIEVLDVDLAGTVSEASTGARIRTMRGATDWPRIRLRYALETDGRPEHSEEDWLSDLDYTRGKPHTIRESEPLYYEKRMLEQWFRERFTGSQAPSR